MNFQDYELSLSLKRRLKAKTDDQIYVAFSSIFSGTIEHLMHDDGNRMIAFS